MGVIRGGLAFVLALGLFFTLFAANLFLTISWSLDYNHVSPYIQNVSNNLAQTSGEKGILLQNYEAKKILCSSNNETNQSISFLFQKEKISVPCEIINSGGKNTIEYVINESIPLYYYKNYSCSLINCVQEGKPLALVSQTAKDYWQQKFNSTILISLVIFALMFLFIKRKYKVFILGGILTIFSAIPMKQITWVLSLLPDLLPFKVIPIFFTESSSVFTIMIILGIILVSIGIGLKFFNWGMKINELTKKIFKRKNAEEKENIKEKKLKNLIDKEIEKKTNKKKK